MTTKQERLYRHAEAMSNLDSALVLSSSSSKVTWGDIWAAQADYLGKHFVERTFYAQMLDALKWADDFMQHRLVTAEDHAKARTAVNAALEAAKEAPDGS